MRWERGVLGYAGPDAKQRVVTERVAHSREDPQVLRERIPLGDRELESFLTEDPAHRLGVVVETAQEVGEGGAVGLVLVAYHVMTYEQESPFFLRHAAASTCSTRARFSKRCAIAVRIP